MGPRILAGVLLLLAAPAGAQWNAPVFPSRVMTDTRAIRHIDLTSDLVELAATATARSVESGFCLYGSVHDSTLTLFDIREGRVIKADSANIEWACPLTPYYVGVAHTHVLVRAPNERCDPGGLTADDFQPILRDKHDIVYMIVCANDIAFLQLADGRFDWFVWRTTDRHSREQL